MTTLDDVLILIPVFDDWQSFARLLVDLDAALAEAGDSAHVLAVDDGSTTALDPSMALALPGTAPARR